MPIPPAQIAELRRVLRGFAAANGPAAVPGGMGKALEAWIFMRLARAARASRNWRVSLRRGDGSSLPAGSTFAFATHQTGIQAAALGAPCYALIEKRSDPTVAIELHGSLQWEGRSKATHEIDVSALPASSASAIRGIGGGHPRGVPIVAIECKDKSGTGTPDEMRQTLARLYDRSLVTPPHATNGCRICGPGTAGIWGSKGNVYREVFAQSLSAIARAGKFSRGARRMGQHYHIERGSRVFDAGSTSIADLKRRFVDVLNEMNTY